MPRCSNEKDYFWLAAPSLEQYSGKVRNTAPHLQSLWQIARMRAYNAKPITAATLARRGLFVAATASLEADFPYDTHA
jgi:hypothetical protein